jgi:hypothetical protein
MIWRLKNSWRICNCLALTIQDLLDALDAYSPTWDRDKPEFFYETLGSNFPDLILTNPPLEEVIRKRDIFLGH